MRRAGWAVLGALVASAALSDSLPLLRPQRRPADLDVADLTTALPEGTIRPVPRPDFGVEPAPITLLRPMPRPDFAAEATPVAQPLDPVPKLQKQAKPSMKGAVCQRAEIKGKTLPPIRSTTKGCNVPDAVLVSEVNGVVLNPPATINCEEATALSAWVAKGLQPAFNNSIIALNVADSYACRPRNNVKGNPVSVHGLGQAIDISGFVTTTGRTYTVAQSYNAQIKAAQKAGCGIFHTILGPGSDGYHENHIHFDVAHHGGRDYCR